MSGIGKDIIVKELTEKLTSSETTIVANYRGLKVKEVTELRKQLREAGVECQVVKNTLACLAAQKGKLQEIEQFLEGPISLNFVESDPQVLAGILTNFAKKYPCLEIKGGVFNKEILTPEQINLWAMLPSREELLAKVAAGIKSPLSGLVLNLKGILLKLVYILEALKKQKS